MATQDIVEDLKMLCTPNDQESSDKAIIYKIPLDLNQECISNGVFKHEVFNKRDGLQEEKVIMVVGGTGVGKTTLINRMVNYIFGVNYTDTFRFQLIEEKGECQTKSRTKDIHIYSIHHKKFPYKITIIDTPGIGSTEGKKEDKKNAEKIRYLFESGAVEAVNAICIIEKYQTMRLTENQIRIYQTIAQIFSKDVEEVIVVMATSCDDIYDDTLTPKPPKVLDTFIEQKIPFKTHYLFNNKDIYAKPITNTKSLKGQVETAFWNSSTEAFKLFFERLEISDSISLVLTKEILRKRYNISYVQLPYLIRTLKANIHEIETLEQDRSLIEKMIKNPDTSKFIRIVNVTKSALEDITVPNQFSTRCKKCKEICHYPCDIQASNYILKSTRWCKAMTWFNPFNIHCTVCPGKCSWIDHEQINKKPSFKIGEEERTDESLKENYMKDKEAKLELVKKQCEEKMLSAYNKVLKGFKDVQSSVDFINKNSLSKDPNTINQCVDNVILSEEEAKEEGYKQRIHCLKKLIEMKHELSPTSDVQQAIAFIQKVQSKD